MAEWTNPIFYLNAAGLVLSILLVAKARDRLENGWFAAVLVLLAATALHFVGDLAGVSEDVDHVFIHAALAVALVFPVVSALRNPS